MAKTKVLPTTLEQNLEDIRDLGTKWGLSVEDIDACFERAIEADTVPRKPSKLCSIWRAFVNAMKVFCVIILVIVCLYYIFFSYDPISHRVSVVMAPYNYAIFRLIRLIGLPITRSFPSISRYYDQECIVANPLYKEDPPKCEYCAKVERVEIKEGSVTLPDTVEGIAQPFVLKNGQKDIVTFEALKEVYSLNSDRLNLGTGIFESNNRSIGTLDDLFVKETTDSLQTQDSLHIDWLTRRVNGAQVLRKVFPRPIFVPQETEVSIERSLFIDGSNSKPYSVSIGTFTNIWYVQSYGSRKLVMYPFGDCMTDCRVLKVTMEPSDILFYSDQFWRVDSIPNPLSGSISISYRGSFY